jgi:hypothetical protein
LVLKLLADISSSSSSVVLQTNAIILPALRFSKSY